MYSYAPENQDTQQENQQHLPPSYKATVNNYRVVLNFNSQISRKGGEKTK